MNAKLVVSIAAVGIIALGLIVYLMFPSYGPIGEKAYQFSVAIDSACSREDVATIERMDQLLAAAVAAEELSTREEKWLRQILALAENEKWDRARQACRSLQEAQLKTNPI